MTTLRITVTITGITALSVGAGGSSGTLADKSVIRDGWGRLIIPGSQLKGKVRWAVEQVLRGLGADIPSPFDEAARVEQRTLVRALFGSPEHQSPLFFADLPGVIGATDQLAAVRTSPEQRRSQIRPSVSINRRRGVAEDARLLFQETALEDMRFFSERAISGDMRKLSDPQGYAALLWAGLTLTTRWGGAKSRGLGWATMDAEVRLDEQVIDATELKQALIRLLNAERGG
jgi:CRISPR/Cas system CSM-associated protein Csm3 (group 7 of RAMP superfamily)